MNRISVTLLTIATLVLTATDKARAADSLSKRYPRVVLVQLRSENNRIEALTKAQKYNDLEQVVNDARSTASAMINDFRDHFNYCPVYYFIDTNLDLIKQKKFDNILMNADRTEVTKPLIGASSSDYLIVFYGYPVAQRRSEKVVKDSARYQSGAEQPSGKGLVINNDKYQQVSYIYTHGYNDIFTSKKQKEKLKPYQFSSTRFEIEYVPLAEIFNRKLKERKDPKKIKITRRSN